MVAGVNRRTRPRKYFRRLEAVKNILWKIGLKVKFFEPANHKFRVLAQHFSGPPIYDESWEILNSKRKNTILNITFFFLFLRPAASFHQTPAYREVEWAQAFSQAHSIWWGMAWTNIYRRVTGGKRKFNTAVNVLHEPPQRLVMPNPKAGFYPAWADKLSYAAVLSPEKTYKLVNIFIDKWKHICYHILCG